MHTPEDVQAAADKFRARFLAASGIGAEAASDLEDSRWACTSGSSPSSLLEGYKEIVTTRSRQGQAHPDGKGRAKVGGYLFGRLRGDHGSSQGGGRPSTAGASAMEEGGAIPRTPTTMASTRSTGQPAPAHPGSTMAQGPVSGTCGSSDSTRGTSGAVQARPSPAGGPTSAYATGWWTQFKVLLWRQFLAITRNPADVAGRSLTFTWVSVVMGILYFSLASSAAGLQIKQVRRASTHPSLWLHRVFGFQDKAWMSFGHVTGKSSVHFLKQELTCIS